MKKTQAINEPADDSAEETTERTSNTRDSAHDVRAFIGVAMDRFKRAAEAERLIREEG